MRLRAIVDMILLVAASRARTPHTITQGVAAARGYARVPRRRVARARRY